MSSEEEPMVWLRKTIEGDLAAAKIISSGGYAPQRWDTEPPGQVNPAHIPQDAAVTAALGCYPDYICGWVQLVAYDKEIGEPDEEYCRDSAAPFALINNGRREFDHIIRHDPRDAVADCEAKLAILDEHGPNDTFGPDDICCSACGDVPQVPFPCQTVRLLASGYRHRPGFPVALAAHTR